MLLCSSYYQNDIYREKVDQIRFSMYNFNNALSYLMTHQGKEIIIEILSLHEEREGHRVCPPIETMKTLQKENNIVYDFYSIDDMLEYYRICKEENKEERVYKFFHHFPATSWGMIRVLLEANVSDIVLGEPFVFMKEAVDRYIHPFARTRAYPHKGKPTLALEFENMPPIQHFFLLPQHTSVYTHIDVLDLLDDNITRETALIDTYTKPAYNFKLKHLIPSIGSEITGAYIDDAFAAKRTNCGQSCMKNENVCHYCKTYEKMYEVVAKRNSALDENIEGS